MGTGSVLVVAAIDVVRKYLDAGVSYAQVTREKAEEIVNDLVKAGEVRADEAQVAVKDLIERSRKSSEALTERIRAEVKDQMAEVKDQLAKVQPASQAEFDALAKRVAAVERKTKAPAKKAPAKKAPAKKAPAKKAPAKKPAAKKSAAK